MFRENDLVLFDRGYPALWLFALLQARGIHFCAHLDAGLWGRILDLIQHGTDERCYLAPLGKRARAVCAVAGVSLSALRLRVVRVRLESGEDEFLVTSLLDAQRYPHHLFRDLYARRWVVEEALKQLKVRLTAENFSGKTALAVRQDFHARVLLAPTLGVVRALLGRLASEAESLRPERSYPRKTSRFRRGYPIAYKPVA